MKGWLEPADYPFCATLERSAAAIAAELEGLLCERVWSSWGTAHYRPTFTKMSGDEIRELLGRSRTEVGEGGEPGWRLFGLYLEGRPIEAGCGRCPRTAAVLAGVPHLVNAGFSCMEAGYRLAPHQGHDPGLVRAHLGLVVPDGDCALAVDGQARRWERGRTLIFDDTHWHEAWNLTGRHRFVLIVDVRRERS
jgi:aspartyl/asparaginyl beta-hydroxylase (cupin superfamily)